MQRVVISALVFYSMANGLRLLIKLGDHLIVFHCIYYWASLFLLPAQVARWFVTLG